MDKLPPEILFITIEFIIKNWKSISDLRQQLKPIYELNQKFYYLAKRWMKKAVDNKESIEIRTKYDFLFEESTTRMLTFILNEMDNIYIENMGIVGIPLFMNPNNEIKMFTFPNTSHFLSYCKNIIHLKNGKLLLNIIHLSPIHKNLGLIHRYNVSFKKEYIAIIDIYEWINSFFLNQLLTKKEANILNISSEMRRIDLYSMKKEHGYKNSIYVDDNKIEYNIFNSDQAQNINQNQRNFLLNPKYYLNNEIKDDMFGYNGRKSSYFSTTNVEPNIKICFSSNELSDQFIIYITYNPILIN
jgi:hypothetical protein